MYLICAVVGGTIIVCQFALTLIGMGGGDLLGEGQFSNAGHDGGDVHHEVGHGNNSTWFVGVLTFRTISAALAFFGLTGLIAQRSAVAPSLSLVFAVCAGACALLLVSWIMKALARLNIDGTVRIEQARGCSGTVYLPIPGGNSSAGKVQINVLNCTMEYKAISPTQLPTGTPVVVVSVIGPDTVEVAPSHG